MKPIQLTPEQEEQHIVEGASQCPLCESDNIDIFHQEFVEDYFYTAVRCKECDCEWQNTYELAKVCNVKIEGGRMTEDGWVE